MEKIYPIDIAGIKNIGVEEWLKGYYIPVTGKEFQTIYDNVFTSFLDVVKQHNDDVVYWVSISNVKVINYISHWILKVLRIIRLREGGYEYIIGKEKIIIPNDISTYKYNSLYDLDLDIINMIGKNISELNFQKRIKNVLRSIKYNFPTSVFSAKRILTDISSPVYIIGNRSQQEVVAYCQLNKITPIHLPSMLFANNSYEKVDKDPVINEVLEFVCRFFVLLENQFPVINSSSFELLRKEIEECFRYSLLFFRQNVKVLSQLRHDKLLATGLGFQIHKIFIASWRYAGGHVIGFTHGNDYFSGYTPGCFHILSLVNHYIAASAGQKEVLQKAAKDFSFGLRMGNITFANQSYYKRLFTELQRKRPVNKIKKVMLVGFPMVDYYFPFFPAGYAFAQLRLELRIGKILRSNGYNVIYKPHPMTANDEEGIFDGYADEVVKARFEGIFDKADCIVFGTYGSTTFGFSMLTNKPMVLIETKGTYWYPRAFELIKQRCSIVDAEAIDGEIVFDEKELLSAIENSLENINYDILYEFAF